MKKLTSSPEDGSMKHEPKQRFSPDSQQDQGPVFVNNPLDDVDWEKIVRDSHTKVADVIGEDLED